MIAGKWEQLNSHPRARDAVVAGVWLLIGLAALQLAGIRMWADFALFDTDGTLYLGALLAIAAVALMRSTRPFLALGLGATIAAVDLAFGGSLGVVLILSDLVYAAVKYGSDRGLRVGLWTALGAAVLLAAGLLVVSPHSPTVPTVAVQLALIIFVSGAWGWAVRSERARTRAALVDAHARQTGEMRERIAHDLHDLVANHIAVAGLHIEAAKLRVEASAAESALGCVPHAAPDPDRPPGPAAATLSSLARAKQGTDAAHRELRALIAVLTATLEPGSAGLGGSERQPEGSLEIAVQLGALANALPGGRALRWQAGALERATADLTASPSAAQAAALRVLRELVANAAKHGTGDVELGLAGVGAGVGVGVSAGPGSADGTAAGVTRTRLVMTNPCAPGAPAAQGSGLGLRSAGLILSLEGGQLESGPAADADAENFAPSAWAAVITLPSPPGVAASVAPAVPIRADSTTVKRY